jgi:crossover junction endodeoxyribonuclease RusA
MNITLTLPWPPSVNHYYRHVGPRVLISREGRAYREKVAAIVREIGVNMFVCPVEVEIELHPPDRRLRDADNSLKCTLDSLTGAGVYEDDSLIQKITVTKCSPMPPNGMAIIRINDYEPTPESREEMPDCPAVPGRSHRRHATPCLLPAYPRVP